MGNKVARCCRRDEGDLALGVAIDARGVDGHEKTAALGCLLHCGLSGDFKVGHGRHQQFILRRVLRQPGECAAAVDVASLDLKEHRHLFASEVAYCHLLFRRC